MLRELRKGSTSLLLLRLLCEQPRYGLELADELRSLTKDELSFKEGTLYPALHRLERDGLVESYWREGEAGPKRRYYRITSNGRAALSQGRQQWSRLVKAVNGALGA